MGQDSRSSGEADGPSPRDALALPTSQPFYIVASLCKDIVGGSGKTERGGKRGKKEGSTSGSVCYESPVLGG